jgi:hypothetical protein
MRSTIVAAGSMASISPAASPNQSPVCSASPRQRPRGLASVYFGGSMRSS